MCFVSRLLFLYLGSISQLAPFSHADNFEHASDCGLGSVALAFERVCALREEFQDFYPATVIESGNEVEGSERTSIYLATLLFCKHILTVDNTNLV